MKRQHNHKYKLVAFDEKTGKAVYRCKCGVDRIRQAKCVYRDDIPLVVAKPATEEESR